jgi:hypothetical protein
VIHGRQRVSQRRPIAFQVVGNDSKRFFSLAPQQSSKESLCGELITARLNQDVDHGAVLIHRLIHRALQVLLLAVDSDEDFIQLQDVAEATPTPLESSSIVRTELLTAVSNGFISDDDSTFGQEIFHIAETHARTMMNPDGMADDFDREAITVVTGTTGFHALNNLAASSSS